MTTFKDLGLAEPLLKALQQEGYTTPTPIQAQAIPTLLTGRDLWASPRRARARRPAFALPILHRLAADRKPAPRRSCRCLVLSPTRELASQIADSFKTYGRHLGMTVAVVYGGVKYGPQIKAMAGGLDILVATPGRLLDHLGEKMLDLSRPRSSCWTKRTRCWTSASSSRSGRSPRACPRRGRTCSSPPPCRARSASWPASC
jgi:ATP-dependent RNA helicase RhlE